MQWCPETGETTLHFDFGVVSDGAIEPLVWRGGYHVSITSVRAAMFGVGRTAMGRGVSHAAFKSGQAITEEDLAPMNPGRAWRVTVRGELQERPERVRVSLRGHEHVDQSTGSLSLRTGFDLLESSALSEPGCHVLSASMRPE